MRIDLQGLSKKAMNFWDYLQKNSLKEIVSAHIAKEMGVANRTIINWCAELAQKGLMKPNLVSKRIRSWRVLTNAH